MDIGAEESAAGAAEGIDDLAALQFWDGVLHGADPLEAAVAEGGRPASSEAVELRFASANVLTLRLVEEALAGFSNRRLQLEVVLRDLKAAFIGILGSRSRLSSLRQGREYCMLGAALDAAGCYCAELWVSAGLEEGAHDFFALASEPRRLLAKVRTRAGALTFAALQAPGAPAAEADVAQRWDDAAAALTAIDRDVPLVCF